MRFLAQRWFLISLAIVLFGGWAGATYLKPLVEATLVQDLVVASVLFVMALPLEARAIGQALRAPAAPLLGTAINLIGVPLCALGASFLLPPDMGAGLLVVSVIPCTLASASVWTRRAGGNDATSFMVTVFTNATCFLVTPLWLSIMKLNSQAFEPGKLVHDLALLVVLPMLIAQMLRLVRPIGAWATREKNLLSVLAQVGILSMVFVGSIKMGLTLRSAGSQKLDGIVLMLIAVNAVHIAMLVLGMQLARWIGLRRDDQIAVGFAGSQKTLMVALHIALRMDVNILPVVTYHVSQLLVDTVIADRIRQADAIRSASESSGK